MRRWQLWQQVEKGSETVEWAVVTLIMAMAGIITLILVREELGRMFQRVLDGFLGL